MLNTQSNLGVTGQPLEWLEKYVAAAKECRAAAAKAATQEERANLLRMADRWEALARQRAAQAGLQDMLAKLAPNDDDHSPDAC